MSTTSLNIGWATADITPEGPVSLFGQYYERIATHVDSPLTATACAIESFEAGGGNPEQAIMISIDLLWCTTAIQEAVRTLVAEQLPDFDVRKLFIFATHTHSGPEPLADTAYGLVLVSRLAGMAVSAWRSRSPSGGVHAAIAYAAIGHNRRVNYADGTTEMYGEVNREDFIGMEGPEDSSMDLLFFRDEQGRLRGIIVNVPCPAQVTEAKYYVSADFWDTARKLLRERFSPDLFILAQCGVAGDISPRDLTRDYKAGEPNMWELEGALEIGRRIDHAVAEAYAKVAADPLQQTIPFKHVVDELEIPLRTVSRELYEESLAIVEEIRSREPADPSHPDTAWNRFLTEIKENEQHKLYGPWDNKKSDYGVVRKKELEVEQYRSHPKQRSYKAEIHVIRLGDVALASNPFELFVDYGFIIKGRTLPKQTFLVQLSCDYADYLPTQRALNGGGYSAMGTSVGVDGGFVLVKRTIELVNNLFV